MTSKSYGEKLADPTEPFEGHLHTGPDCPWFECRLVNEIAEQLKTIERLERELERTQRRALVLGVVMAALVTLMWWLG